jgi:hypothetical protein
MPGMGAFNQQQKLQRRKTARVTLHWDELKTADLARLSRPSSSQSVASAASNNSAKRRTLWMEEPGTASAEGSDGALPEWLSQVDAELKGSLQTFENMFCIDPSAPKATKPTSAPKARQGFLEPNRARTIGIIAMKFERQYSPVPKVELPTAIFRAIEDASSAGTDGVPLNADEIEALQSIVPTPEEMREFPKVDASMGWEEQFLAGIYGRSPHTPRWLEGQAIHWRWLGCAVSTTNVPYFARALFTS